MSLNLAFCPSIHPHASAPSSASAYVSDVEPDSFFAIFSHNPRDEAWWVTNHSDQALAVANESTGRSSAAVSTCEALRPPFTEIIAIHAHVAAPPACHPN